MATLGRACLMLALAVAIYSVVASLYGVRTGRRDWVASGRRAIYALAFILTVAFATLEVGFLRSDFALQVVATHSSTITPAFYKATAIWSSQEGSLMLWVWLLALWSALVLYFTRDRAREIAPYAAAVLGGFAVFFCGLLIFNANPFALASPVPAEGAGLNPLLRNPAMMIHPPMLYAGYTLWAVPFAFAVGALVTRRVDAEWIRLTRRFALGAWFFLGIGIMLGARWSYSELGWGGYWGWDPVENASLLPWLTGTAFIHSVMIQEKRGMLKVWNASLILATGTLAILGTFLVRSGILESIHAFGASTLGTPFLVLIGLMTVGSIALVVMRRDALRSEHRLDSLLSREAVFIVQNLILVALAFVVFWGTFFPLISEAVTGTKASVGPPWFNRYTVPLALVLVLLSGVGPLLAWRRVTAANLRRSFIVPTAIAVVALAGLLVAGVGERPLALAMFVFAAFVIAAVGQEFVRGVRARRVMSGESPPAALVSLVRRNRRRYGGYTVHVGFAVLMIGVAASSAFQHPRDLRLSPGQSATVDGFKVTYVRPTTDLANERISLGAIVDVTKDGRRVARLQPSRNYYPSRDAAGLGVIGRFFQGEATSEVGLKSGLRRDIWTAVQPDLTGLMPFMAEADKKFANAGPDLQGLLVTALTERYRLRPPPAQFRVIVSPLVMWIWIGGLIVIGGALIAMWPAPEASRRRASAGAAARVARDLGRA